MRQSQLPLLGLLLALFVGARVSTPGGASEGGPTASAAGKYSSSSQPAKEGAVPRHSGRQVSSVTEASVASDLVESGCDVVTATSKAGTFHISKSTRTSGQCLPPLPPLYQTLCRLNSQYSFSDETRYRLELAALRADKPALPQCFAGLGGDEGLSIDSVMASVPDPEHTHLGLLTDRAIEAIQVAAGKAGYDPYSHFLPWTSSDLQKNSNEASASESDADSHEPGVLIFRGQEPPLLQPSSLRSPQYLVVFLIPELPTTGLDKESFVKANSTMQQISRQLGQPELKVIPFAGPNFSGSKASLQDIDFGLDQTQCIHAFSGQVTAATYSHDKSDDTGKHTCTSVLVSTQTLDQEAVPLLVKGLQDYGYQRKQIAVLSEGGTTFGNQATKIGDKSRGEDGDADEDAKCDPAKTADPQQSSSCQVLSMQFPREISKLRNAYGAEAGQTTPAASANQQTSDVQMSWQDSQASRGDDVHAYGGRQTPLSQEAVLSTLANVLKSRRIRVLGIFATDPMDEAFLIRSFRKSSPEVRLFLPDPDLLYLRTPDVGSLNGTLLVNNFPLVLRNQFWNSGGPDKVVTFPSAAQEAQYDAFLLLLQEMDIGFPDSPTNPPFVERDWPSGNLQSAREAAKATPGHPLWLTTVGTAGYFPLAILNVDESNERTLLPRSLDVGGPRHTSMMLWVLFAGLGVLHILGLSWPNALPRLICDDFDLGDARDAITASRAVCHVAILLSLALIQLMLGSSYLFFRDLKGYAWYARGVALVALALAITACVVFMIGVAWPWWQSRRGVSFRNEDLSGVLRPLVGGILCIGIFAAVGAFWVHGAFQPTFRNTFLHFRDLIPSSGMAPCLPIVLLLVVAYLAAWAYLRRLTYWGYRRPPLPTLALDSIYSSDFAKTVQSIDKCILGFLESWGWGVGFMLAFIAGVLAFRPWSTMDMTEVLSVRGMVLVLFVLAFFALGLNWFRFLNIWSRLRNVLEGLERLPIRHAFERIPAEKSMPIWGWSISDNSFMPSSQPIERLRALVLADDTVVSALSVRELRSRISVLGNFGEQKRQGIWRLLFLLLQGPREQLVELPQAVGAPRMVVSVNARRDRLIVNPDTPTFGEVWSGARQAMTEVVHQLILFLRPGYWQRGSDGSKQETPQPELRTFMLAEDLVAMRYYAYIRYVVTELRNLLFFVVMAFSLMFLAFHTYAFRADEAIDWSFLGLFLILGTGVTVVLYQMELDQILSHFGGGQPGEVGWSFYLNLLKYGAVPFLTVVGSQVPAVSNLLLRWVQPTLQSLR
jgi:hypothetical protein